MRVWGLRANRPPPATLQVGMNASLTRGRSPGFVRGVVFQYSSGRIFRAPSDSTWLESVLGRRRQRHLRLNPSIIKRTPQDRAFNPGAGFA